MTTELRIATRASKLALTQARWVADLLEESRPGTATELVPVTSSGDRDRVSSVTALTEVGAFVRAVQQAVLDGDADLAVHSCKDLPIAGPEGLATLYPRRESPWDVLCGSKVDALPEGARVATGSPRRAAQLRRLRPDLEIVSIRGNVDTRLAKMAAGDADALVLAEAGLTRLGLTGAIAHRFTVEEMVPAPGQGALAVQAIAGGDAAAALRTIEHRETKAAVDAERALLAMSGAGCRSALGAYAAIEGHVVRLHAFVEDDDGPRQVIVLDPDPLEAARLAAKELGVS